MLIEIFYILLFAIILAVIALFALVTWARHHFHYRRQLARKWVGPSIGFFHPYCNMGGGGERVLWCAVRALQNRYKDLKVVVYTGDIDASPTEIMNKVENQLNIVLPRPVDFIYLHKRAWVEAERYPYFTLLGQSLGSVRLGIEAMSSFLPDVYIDTMGYAFTLPLFKYIGGCNVSCYVHYPTITRDMYRRVANRVVAHNNSAVVAKSPILSFTKAIYYRIFAWLYSTAGRFADIALVNSSWTEDHINKLWDRPLTTHRVYPPCDTNIFKELERSDDDNNPESQIRIVSVGQFRPEKDHPLQLKALYQLRIVLPEDIWERVRLVFVGSCRNEVDERRVKDMRDLCKHLSLENNVEFKVNVSFEELKNELTKGMIGLHAMWNEHFGIGVVECMAAGLIMVAHGSGGPKMDIIEEAESSRNGFLACNEVDYANVIAAIIKLPPSARETIRTAARASVDRFSVTEFENGFVRAMDPFFSYKKDS